MSEELFVNIATEVQQPYIARVPVNAQQPNIRTMEVQGPASGRQPSTYQYRSPFIYNNPVSAQEPNIRDARQPFTYTRQGQTPTTYQHRSPFTYARQGQQPAIYQHQQPYPYIAAAQSNETKSAQQPYPYIANARQPGFYQHPSPFTYQNPVNAQEPNIRDAQVPYPYIAAGQEPNIRSQQEPNIRNSQTPFTYRNPVNGQEPNIRQARQPSEYQHRSPFTYNHRSPLTYDHQSPFTYRNPVSAQEPNIREARQPAIYQYRSPFTYQNPVDSQTPFTYQLRTPFTYRNPVDAQQPTIKSAQQPYPYIANGQTPFTYQHRSPFTYARQGRNPFTYSLQTPATTSQQQPLIAQRPYIFDGIDGDDSNPTGTTIWGPGNPAATLANAGATPMLPVSPTRAWNKEVNTQSGSACNTKVAMEFFYNGTTAATVKAKWYGIESTDTSHAPTYADTINHHSPAGIDSTWSWAVKWNSTGEFGYSSKGIAFAPHEYATTSNLYKAKNTYYNLWNGTTQNAAFFHWTASVSNQGEAEATVTSTGTSFVVRVSKTGETSLYTSYSAGTVYAKAFNNGGSGGGGGPFV